jgi:membrane protein
MRRFAATLAEALRNAINDGSLSTAKGAAYSLVLAFFPTLLLLATALAGTETTSQLAKEITRALGRVLPPTSRELALQYFDGKTVHSMKIILAAASIALFGATGVMGSFIQGFRAAYRLKYNWTLWHEEGLALALVFMAGTPMLAATTLVVFGQQVQNWMLQRTEYTLAVLLAGAAVRWVVALATGTLVLGIMYYLGPNCEDSFHRVLPGALSATVAWLLASAGFGWYVKNVAVYSGIYGSLGTMVALMIWMYLAAVIVLIGCQFNAANERRRRGGQPNN